MLIIRFLIIKHPINKRKTKIISICYWIATIILIEESLIISTFITGFYDAMSDFGYYDAISKYRDMHIFLSTIIGSFIGYKILTKHSKGDIVPFVKKQNHYFSINSDTIKIKNAKAKYNKTEEKREYLTHDPSKYAYIDINIEGQISSEYYGKNIGFNIDILDSNKDSIAGSAWENNKIYVSTINKDGSFNISTTLKLEEKLKNSIHYAEFKHPKIQ